MRVPQRQRTNRLCVPFEDRTGREAGRERTVRNGSCDPSLGAGKRPSRCVTKGNWLAVSGGRVDGRCVDDATGG